MARRTCPVRGPARVTHITKPVGGGRQLLTQELLGAGATSDVSGGGDRHGAAFSSERSRASRARGSSADDVEGGGDDDVDVDAVERVGGREVGGLAETGHPEVGRPSPSGARPSRALVLGSTHEEIAIEDIGPEDVIALSGDAREQIVRSGHETELLDLGETKGMAA